MRIPRCSARWAAALVAIACALALAPASQAAVTTINFADQSPGTALGTQYAAQGVTFGVSPNGPDAPIPLTVADVAGEPAGTHVASLSCVSEVCSNYAWMQFSGPVPYVALTVSGTSISGMTATAEDGSGAQVGSSTVTFSGPGFVHLFVPAAQGKSIRFLKLTPSTPGALASGQGYDFTNLSFDLGTGPQTPDFGLISGVGPGGVGIVAGGPPAQAQITLRRYGGSSGPITFSHGPLPGNVDVTFAPNPDSGGDFSTETVTFTASAGASPVANVPVTITGTPSSTAGTSAHSVTIPLTVQGTYYLGIKAMEITQGVQTWNIPHPDLNDPFAPAPYTGVRLVKGMRTVVRVWAYVQGSVPLSGLRGVTMSLSAENPSGQQLPPTALDPEVSPSFVSIDAGNLSLDRTRAPGVENSEFDFVLPDAWTQDLDSITASLHPPPGSFGQQQQNVQCGTPACVAALSFTVNQISSHLFEVGATPFNTVIMTDHTGTPNSYSELKGTTLMFPANLSPQGDVGTIDIDWISRSCQPSSRGGCGNRQAMQDEAMSLLEDFYDNWDFGQGPPLVAVAPADAGLGMENGDLIDNGEQPLAQISAANIKPQDVTHTVDMEYSLVGAGHEIGHMFGLPHAGNECGGGDDGDSDDHGQVGEPWPPDQVGFVDGLGLNPFADAPFTLLAPSVSPGVESQFSDFMSYCVPGNPDAAGVPTIGAWISPRNWDYLVTFNACVLKGGSGDVCEQQANAVKQADSATATQSRDGSSRPASSVHSASADARAVTAAAGPGSGTVTAPAGRGYTRVYGFQTPSGTALSLIDPTPAARRIEGLASPFGLVVLGRHGHVLARRRMLMRTTHTDGPHGGPVVLLKGAVPTRAGASAIAITEHGKVVAVRRRPAHAPRVRLLAPRRGRRLSIAKPFVVRWRATDRDRRRLMISIDYSTNRGRRWRMVAMVPNTGRATLRGSLLRPSRHARIRIRVNDGFDQVIAVSGLVRVTRTAH